jgi:hypothetical protein
MRPHWFARLVLLGVGIAALASAQTFPLQLRVSENNQVAIVANQSTLPFTASVGQLETLQGTATYTGSGKITITQHPTVFGSTQFSADVNGTLPITLNSGDSFSFVITYTPTSTASSSAIFTLPFTETTQTTGTQPTTTVNNITFSLIGTAASFVVSYIKDGNAIQVPNGGSIVFDPQPVNTTVTLPVDITNNGGASGVVNSITVTGKAFQIVGRPVLPITIPGGNQLPIGIEYSPTAVGTDTGQLMITYGDGTTLTATLQGSATSPTLVYTIVSNSKTTTVTPPGPIPFPDTNVGSTSSLVVRVQNKGNGSATVGTISVAGTAFQASSEPVLPKTLNTNDSFTFTLTFAPTQPGVQTGQLLVGADLFNLSGKGLGSELQFSYVSGGVPLTIGTNGVTGVVFSPVQITKSASIPFTVKNIGTLPAVISSIAIQGTNSPFSVTGTPALPKTVAPNASFSFTVTFAPTSVQFVNDTLLINTTPVPLSGQGTAPPPLPAYTISGASGTVAPQSQPTITLKLASPYPVALNGVLTLTTNGTLGSDPAVQFTVDNRAVPFTIPAGSTVANFAQQGNQIQLQTGTVASTIILTPTFTTAVGDVDLTPTNPTTLQFTVPAEAPVLLDATLASSSANSIVLNFTGYSTTRTLTTLNLQFTAAAGFTLGTTQLSVPISGPSAVWFGSASSQGSGGQFTISMPLTFSGTTPTGVALLQTIASVTGTVSNGSGTSNAVTTPIQ